MNKSMQKINPRNSRSSLKRITEEIMKYAPNTPVSWLISCPVSDGNFKNALKNASMSELQLALEEIPQEGNKTKRKAIECEIKRRNK